MGRSVFCCSELHGRTRSWCKASNASTVCAAVKHCCPLWYPLSMTCCCLATTAVHSATRQPAGSVDELEKQQGIAHLVEHVTFLGSQKREGLLGTGARSNAYTDFHHTVFHVHAPLRNANTQEPMLPQVSGSCALTLWRTNSTLLLLTLHLLMDYTRHLRCYTEWQVQTMRAPAPDGVSAPHRCSRR